MDEDKVRDILGGVDEKNDEHDYSICDGEHRTDGIVTFHFSSETEYSELVEVFEDEDNLECLRVMSEMESDPNTTDKRFDMDSIVITGNTVEVYYYGTSPNVEEWK